MKDQEYYNNGQMISVNKNGNVIYYYKNGNRKAEGKVYNDLMEGEWKFYNENGKLWQIGNYKRSLKDGIWTRFDEKGRVIYKKFFVEGNTKKDYEIEDVKS